MSADNPTFQRLEDQIGWYDRKSGINQRWFKGLTIAELVGAALIPLAAGAGVPAVYVGSLGVALILMKGLQRLNQYQQNWITYRSTCEALKHEKYLWLARAGPYADAARPEGTLAERVESLVSTEHAKWIAGRQQAREELERLARPDAAAPSDRPD